MDNILEELQRLVDELQKTNSSNEKKEILKRYESCLEILKWIYSSYYVFGITSDNLKKRMDLCKNSGTLGIFEILDSLVCRTVTGHEALSLVNGFIESNKEYEELIYNIIDKNLKCRIDAKLINNVFPKSIPVFDVVLAKKYHEHKKKVDFEKDKYYVSRKLDGVRCVIIVDEKGNAKAFSRTGKEFETLGNLLNVFNNYGMKKVVFDGEICLMDESGIENFQDVMKEIRRKNHIIKNPRYIVFDTLTLDEFKNGKSNLIFSERQKSTFAIINEIANNMVVCLEQLIIQTKEQLDRLLEDADNSGWEGLILRKNMPYKSGRTDELLKVKTFFDAEYEVIDTENTTKRMIIDGIEKEIECMGAVGILHRDNRVGVGSGWSDEERIKYYENPEEIIGKTITVKYKKESQDQYGNQSLQFPVKKIIHGNKREF